MPVSRHRRVVRIAAAAALIAALGLAGCGRKGPLDPPPSAAVPGGTAADPNPTSPQYGPNGEVLAPQGAKKRIILDRLLD